jgi:hypothetical protein
MVTLRCLLLSVLVLACAEPVDSIETGQVVEPGITESIPQDTADPIEWDRDQDGFTDGEDCNDYDADVYPGAVESWNAVDDDCNGRVDADGTYSGSVQTSGGVVIEGVETLFSMSCPVVMIRSQATLELEIHCTPEKADAIAVLGEELWLTVSETGLSGSTWTGRGLLVSSQGWDTTLVELEVEWSEFSRASLLAIMSSSMASLNLTSSGDLDVEEPG